MSSNMIKFREEKKKKTKNIARTNLSDSEHFSGLKSVFSEIRDVFRNTRLQKEVILPLDYRKIAGVFSDEEEISNSTVPES